jgi:NADPH:quinone reductase and related Zn-dependent oxidoreductases
MKAAVVTENGVQVKDAPKPAPKPHEILIKVRGVAQPRRPRGRLGHRHGTVGGTGTIVGLECAGEVEAVGGDVKDFRPGDRVMSSAAGGFADTPSPTPAAPTRSRPTT